MTTQERISTAQIVDAIQSLPDDAGVEQAIERPRFMQAVQEGFRQLDAGQSVSRKRLSVRLPDG